MKLEVSESSKPIICHVTLTLLFGLCSILCYERQRGWTQIERRCSFDAHDWKSPDPHTHTSSIPSLRLWGWVESRNGIVCVYLPVCVCVCADSLAWWKMLTFYVLFYSFHKTQSHRLNRASESHTPISLTIPLSLCSSLHLPVFGHGKTHWGREKQKKSSSSGVL